MNSLDIFTLTYGGSGMVLDCSTQITTKNDNLGLCFGEISLKYAVCDRYSSNESLTTFLRTFTRFSEKPFGKDLLEEITNFIFQEVDPWMLLTRAFLYTNSSNPITIVKTQDLHNLPYWVLQTRLYKEIEESNK